MNKNENPDYEKKVNEKPNENNQDDEAHIKEDPEKKVKELEEKLVRALAEIENQRRRYEKEKDDAFDYGGFNFAREALNLIDNLERSRSSIQNDENLKDINSKKKIMEQLEIINKDILTIFIKNNIEPINCLNEKLDPNLHQAMMEIEDETKETGTIVQEIQKGFMMKNRLLRPSLVGVSKKPANANDEKSAKNKEKKT